MTELTNAPSLAEERLRQRLDLVVVIPTLNEKDGIAFTIDEVKAALRDVTHIVLIVDGHSTDGTDKIARDKGVQVIYQNRTGYGDALRTGFLYVRKRINPRAIVMMDADATYNPHDIKSIVEPILADHADMVVGNRMTNVATDAMTRTNRAGNKILSWVARKTLRLNVHDTQCGLRAFRTELVDDLDLSAEGMPLATEMIADAHFARARIVEVPVSYRPRSGETKLNPIKDGARILGTIIRLVRDTQPLLFFGTAGSICGLLGLFFGIQVTLEWLETHTVRKIPTVMLSTLLLIASMILLAVGLIADMIKRVRSKMINRY